MKYSLLFFLTSAALLSCSSSKNAAGLSEMIATGKWIDLSYDFSAQTLYWPNTQAGFVLDTLAEGITPGGYYYSSCSFSAPEHGGTHLDAPVHFAAGGLSADRIPLDKLTGNAVVIDVSGNALKNADYLISVKDITDWEKKNGAIPENTIVIFKTGYGQFYPDAAKYLGTTEKGAAAIPKLHFPGIDAATAVWLTQHKIKAAGIDTPSIDYGQSKDFKTHQVLMAAGIPGFENLANLQVLPVKGAYIVALPMKIKNGTGGPLRIVAWVKN